MRALLGRLALRLALVGAVLVLVPSALATAPSASLVARDQQVVSQLAERIQTAALNGGSHGPTPQLLTALRRLRVDLAAANLSVIAKGMALSQALGAATRVCTCSFVERAAIYHALGYKTVG